MLPSKGDNASDSGVGSSSDDNPGPATDQSNPVSSSTGDPSQESLGLASIQDASNLATRINIAPVQNQGQPSANFNRQSSQFAPLQFGSMPPIASQRLRNQAGQTDSPVPASPATDNRFGYYGSGLQQPPSHARPGGITPGYTQPYGYTQTPASSHYGPLGGRPHPEIHRYGDERDLMTPEQIAAREYRPPTMEEPGPFDMTDTGPTPQHPSTPAGTGSSRRPAVLGPMSAGVYRRQPVQRRLPSDVQAANFPNRLTTPPAVYRSPAARSGREVVEPALYHIRNPPATPATGLSSSPFRRRTSRSQRPVFHAAGVAQQTPSRAPAEPKQPKTPNPPRTQDALRLGAHEQTPGTPMPRRAQNAGGSDPSATSPSPGAFARNHPGSERPHRWANIEDPFTAYARALAAQQASATEPEAQPATPGPSGAIVRADNYDILSPDLLARLHALFSIRRGIRCTPAAIFTWHQLCIADDLYYGGIWTQLFMVNNCSIIEYHNPAPTCPDVTSEPRNDRHLIFTLMDDARQIRAWARIRGGNQIIPGSSEREPPIDFESTLNLVHYVFDRLPSHLRNPTSYAQAVAPNHVNFNAAAETQNRLALYTIPNAANATRFLLIERDPTVIARYGGLRQPRPDIDMGNLGHRTAARRGPAAGTRQSTGVRSSAREGQGGLPAMSSAASTAAALTIAPAPENVGTDSTDTSAAAPFQSTIAPTSMPNNGDTFFNSFTSRVATPNTTTTNPLANVSQDWTLNTQSNHEGSNTNAVSNTSNTTSRLPSFLPPIDTLVNSSMEFTPDAVENDTAPGMVTAAPLYGSAAESMDWMNNLQPIPNEFATDAATGADTTTAGSVPFSDEPMDISTMSDMESDPSGFGTGTDTLPGADTSVVSAPSSAGPVDMFGNINYDFSLDPSWTGTDNTAAASASTSATPWNTSNTGNMTFGLTGSEMNTLMTEGVVNVWRPISAASVDLSSIPDMAFNPSSGTGTGTAPTANTGTAPADMSNNENMEFYFDILPPGMGAVPSNVTASDTSSNVNMDFSSWTGMNTAPDADTTTTTTANTSAAGPIDTYGTGNNSGFETDAIPDAAAMTTATNDTPAPLPSHVAPTDLYSFDNSEFLFHPATNSDLDTAESPSTMLPAPEPVNGNTNTVSGVEVTPSTNVPTQEQEDEVTNNNTADAYDPAPTFEGAEFFDWEALAQWGNENNNNNGDDDEDDGDTPMN